MLGGIERLAGDSQHGEEGSDHADLRRALGPRRGAQLGRGFPRRLRHALLEGIQQLEHLHRFLGRSDARLAGDLGLDERRKLLGRIVPVAIPVDRPGDRIEEHRRQPLLFGTDRSFPQPRFQGRKGTDFGRVVQEVHGQEPAGGTDQRHMAVAGERDPAEGRFPLALKGRLEHQIRALRGKAIGDQVQRPPGEQGSIDLMSLQALLQDQPSVLGRSELLQLGLFQDHVLFGAY